MAYSIHSVCGYMLIIMITIYFLYQRTIPLFFSIPALLFATYFFSEWFDFSWLNPILSQFVGEDEHLMLYVDNADKWFSSEGMEEKYVRSPLILAFEMLGTISLYILGAKVINKYVRTPEAYAMYNYFVIGSIMLNAFRQLEILNRIGGDFAIFWFFPVAMVLQYRKHFLLSMNIKRRSIISNSSFWGNSFYKTLSVFLLWFVYDYLKYLFMRGEMTKFLWDI